MVKSNKLVIILVICIIVLLIPACQTIQPSSGGNLKIILRQGLPTFGAPGEATGPAYLFCALPVYENMFRHDQNFRIKPKLAESYFISPDGKYLTVTLKKGLKFHDGTSYNAESVKYVIEKAGVGFANYLVNVSSIEAVDEYTVRINFKTFDYGFLINLAEVAIGFSASPTAMKIKAPDTTQIKERIAGTGPFKFVSWQRNGFVKYEKNVNYWQQGKPFVDTIEIREIIDPVTSLMSFKAGEADVLTFLLPDDVKDLKDAGFEILVSDYPLNTNLIPDSANANSPFADKRVREAVEYAIDKKAITQSIGRGIWQPTDQWATSKQEYFDPSVKPRTYDVKKAKELLASAGYPNGFKTKIIAENIISKEYLQSVQAFLKSVGIDAVLEIVDNAKLQIINKEGWNNGLLSSGGNGGIVSLQRYISATSTQNKSMLRSKELLSKLDAAQTSTSEKAHIERMRELMKYMADECIVVPVFVNYNLFATTKKVRDSGFGIGWGSWFDPENINLSK